MKKIYLYIISFIIFSSVCAQDGLPIPPSRENTKYFTFRKFDRQPIPPEFIERNIKQLKKSSFENWTAIDSLYYAYELTYLKNYDHALSYFNKLNTDTLTNNTLVELYHLTLRKTGRFQTLVNSIDNLIQLQPKKIKVLKIRKRLAEVRLYKRDLDWNLDSKVIFSNLDDSIYHNFKPFSPAVLKKTIPKVKAYDAALRIDTRYSDDTDRVLSKAYEEFGDFLYNSFYASNAYIAYSIARHFDRKNNRIVKKIKKTKERLNKENHLYPSFISLFPKIDDKNTSYSKFSILDSIQESSEKEKIYPDLEELLSQENKARDYIPWLNTETIAIFILLALLVFTIFFVKSDKKS